MSEQPTFEDVDQILADPTSARYRSLRDRVAYVYLTGSYPSHLRVPTTRILALISTSVEAPAGEPERPGGTYLLDGFADRLDLEAHPMVVKVRQFIDDGYQIRLSLGPNERKSYSKVLLFRADDRRTIQIDGAVKEGWG